MGQSHRYRTTKKQMFGEQLVYYGNYCGPNWSGGKKQPSIGMPDGPDAIDRLDQTCREHDSVYHDVATGKLGANALRDADIQFAFNNIGRGTRATVYGVGVGLQGLFRKKTMPPVKRKEPDTVQRDWHWTKYRKMSQQFKRDFGPKKKEVMAYATRKRKSVGQGGRASTKRFRAGTKAKSVRGSGAYTKRAKKNGRSLRRRSTTSNASKKKGGNTAFQVAGSVTNVESGFTKTDADCVYVGAGTPVNEVHQSFWRAVVSALFKKRGIDITSWNDRIALYGTHNIDISYIPEGTSTQTTFSTGAMVSTTTFNTAAFQLYSNALGTFSAATATMIWMDAVLIDTSNTQPVNVCRVSLQQLTLDLEVVVNVTLQNQTTADSGSASTDVVATNPIKGKMYKFYGNKLMPKSIPNTGATQLPVEWLTATADYGLIEGTQYSDDTKKPPAKNFFKCQSATPLSLMPGAVAKASIKRRQKFSWTKGMMNLQASIADSNIHRNYELGAGLVFALEKMLDTRTPDEVVISTGVQTDITVKCKYGYKKPAISAVRNVVN